MEHLASACDGDRLAEPDVSGLECPECREPCERSSARLRGVPELLAKPSFRGDGCKAEMEGWTSKVLKQ